MSLMSEYIKKRLSIPELESELLKLISQYNKLRDSYLLVYAAATGKPIPNIQLEQSDFYLIHDLLTGKKDYKYIDMYIETPGGRGETAEEIVKFLRNNFDKVSFVVSGEAKSAGTIVVLSGDEILMTETGSLGPIDAQMKIGRSVVSAYDYIEWVEEKREEAGQQGSLNPFDATMVAQISPGELGSVLHSLKYAEDLVVEWLQKYKFKKWDVTETLKIPVTEDMKKKRANEIALELQNHAKWRLHGRSVKIDDLDGIGLKITRVDNDKDLAEIVYRIQIVCRIIFETTTTFKIFAIQDDKIFRHTVKGGSLKEIPKVKLSDAVEIKQNCQKCGIGHNIYAKFTDNPKIDVDYKNKGLKPFPKDAKITCECGFEIDLSGIKNEIELKVGRKIII